jgi:hypothetical protein
LDSISEDDCNRFISSNVDVRDDTRVHVPQEALVSKPASPAEIAINYDPALATKSFAMIAENVPPKLLRRSQ